MKKKKIIIATRGSELALIQSNFVKSWIIDRHPDIVVELTIIKTTGDKILDSPLSKVGEKGLFVKEIEEALLDKKADIAVHSMKDVPTALPEGLHITAIGEREPANDVFISNKYSSLKDLPPNAKIATSSLRRRVQLLYHFSNLNIVDIRGNLNTRLKKLKTNDLDGIILAYAGINRIGLNNLITEIIPTNIFIPAVGQGALGIESRCDDHWINDILLSFNHKQTHRCLISERAFMRRLEGGCQVPIGGYAYYEGDNIILEGMVSSLDGKDMIIDSIKAKPYEAEDMGLILANKLLDRGAKDILSSISRL